MWDNNIDTTLSPQVNLTLSGNTVMASITGEDGAFLIVGNSSIGRLISGGFSANLGFISCGSTRSLSFQLRDRAGNLSQVVSRSISRRECPVLGIGGGDGINGDEFAWATANINNHMSKKDVNIKILIDEWDNIYVHGDLDLQPQIKIIDAIRAFGSEFTYVYAVNLLPQFFYMHKPVDVYKRNYSLRYALNVCEVTPPLFIFSPLIRNLYRDCVSDIMTIPRDIFEKELNKHLHQCEKDLGYHDLNKIGSCFVDNFRKYDKGSDSIMFLYKNVKTTLHNTIANVQTDISFSVICDGEAIGVGCSNGAINYIGEDGRLLFKIHDSHFPESNP